LGFPSSWPATTRCFWLEHMEAYALTSTFPISALERKSGTDKSQAIPMGRFRKDARFLLSFAI
jgi:hypothetical protein